MAKKDEDQADQAPADEDVRAGSLPDPKDNPITPDDVSE